MASYVIEYHKGGLRRAVSPHAGPLKETIEVAHEGMMRHDADFARVIDTDSSAEVIKIQREASGD